MLILQKKILKGSCIATLAKQTLMLNENGLDSLIFLTLVLMFGIFSNIRTKMRILRTVAALFPGAPPTLFVEY